VIPAGPGGSLREARGRQDAKYDVEKMKDNSEPEEDRGVETDYSAEEAEQMGAFVEDALSFKDARESVDDFEQRRLC
jgi:hypothetical protein